jgi:replicative DNA helicase
VPPEPPYSRQAEWSVITRMLTNGDAIAEVIGAQMEPSDFFSMDCRLIYEAAVEAYYADQAVTPVSIGERVRVPLAATWNVPENEVSQKLYETTRGHSFDGGVQDHVELIGRLSDKRRLLELAQSTIVAIQGNELSPQEIGDKLTTEAAAITAGKIARGEVMPWMDVGRDYLKYLNRLRLARESGIEMAAYFGLPFMDSFTKGLAPTELMMVAGEPGVGKSAVTWKAAEGFAHRQQKNPPDQRIGTLILSLEMGLIPSTGRLATSMTGIDSGRLREGDITKSEMEMIARHWSKYEDLGIFFNFASNFRLSQLRALVVEAIRRHNVGLIVLDHFRMVDPDRRVNNPNQEDEAKARFLKENICKDLNVAVMCLAHTVKIKRENSDGRPTLNDLRGSYQVAAHCDMVGFIYRPIMYATEIEIEERTVSETDAEMIWAKNRNGQLGSMPFHFDPAQMVVQAA